jgi:chorismate mutase
MMSVRAARGAIVVSGNGADAVLASTEKLLTGILDANEIERDDLISILFTATDDLVSVFPAEAARRMGLGAVPLMCAREISVEDSLRPVVRVLMHFHTGRSLDEVIHVYLDGAETLRDDLEAG